jgi:hypothetical protein
MADTVSQMCTCGAKFQAESIPAVWQLMDAHIDTAHGRRFPTASYGTRVAHKPRRGGHKAPLTPQGGES